MSSQPVSAAISTSQVVATLTAKVEAHTLSFWGKVACITFCWLALIPLFYWACQHSEKSEALQKLKAKVNQLNPNDPTELRIHSAARRVLDSNNQLPEVHLSGQEPVQKQEIYIR